MIPIEQDDPRDGIWTSTDDLLSLLQADFDRQLTDLGVPLAAQAALWSAVVNHEAVDIEGIVSQMTDSATPVSHEALLARFQGGAYDLIFSLDGTSGVGQQITQDLDAHGVTYDELIAFGSLYRQMAQAGSEEELLAGKALLGQLETATAQIPEQMAGMSLASIRLAAAAFNRSYQYRVGILTLSCAEAGWMPSNSPEFSARFSAGTITHITQRILAIIRSRLDNPKCSFNSPSASMSAAG